MWKQMAPLSDIRSWSDGVQWRKGGGLGRNREEAFKESGEASGWELTRKDRKLLDSSANRRVRMLAIEAAKKKWANSIPWLTTRSVYVTLYIALPGHECQANAKPASLWGNIRGGMSSNKSPLGAHWSWLFSHSVHSVDRQANASIELTISKSLSSTSTNRLNIVCIRQNYIVCTGCSPDDQLLSMIPPSTAQIHQNG